MSPEPRSGDVVLTAVDADGSAEAPLIIIEPLCRYLASLGIEGDELKAEPIGNGHSNVTYELRFGGERLVLRRPPRPPFPVGAHNVVREARLLRKLEAAGAAVPHVSAICEDKGVIGAPFYLMDFLEGTILSDALPSEWDTPAAGRAIGTQLIEVLVALHAIDVDGAGLSGIGRPGYLARQLLTFGRIWGDQRTRDLPEMQRVERWLGHHLPRESETTLVHGDFRLGNAMFKVTPPPRIAAVLDWEMSTLGDPLADLGYLRATWAVPGADENPMNALSAVTRLPEFMSVDEVCGGYAEVSGRDISGLSWYEVLALWKAAVFLESSYRRFLEGTTADPYFAQLGSGVPALAREALARTGAC